MTIKKETNAIILAAGKGSRMKSETIKVLHDVAGKSILGHVLDAVTLSCDQLYVVVGYQANAIKSKFLDKNIQFVEQNEQLGTGHAVDQVIPSLNSQIDSNTIVLAGDCPLIQSSTLEQLFETHQNNNAAVTILTTHMKNPHGYGRILRDNNQTVLGIKEQKDCSDHELKITEINSGIYVFKTDLLINNIKKITPNNKQAEYYLTDMIQILQKQNEKIETVILDDENEISGVNTRADLAHINKTIYQNNNVYHMSCGVTIIDPSSTFIDSDVLIGMDTVIHPFSVIRTGSVIGKGCHIGPFALLDNQQVIDFDTIAHNVATSPIKHT